MMLLIKHIGKILSAMINFISFITALTACIMRLEY